MKFHVNLWVCPLNTYLSYHEAYHVQLDLILLVRSEGLRKFVSLLVDVRWGETNEKKCQFTCGSSLERNKWEHLSVYLWKFVGDKQMRKFVSLLVDVRWGETNEKICQFTCGSSVVSPQIHCIFVPFSTNKNQPLIYNWKKKLSVVENAE
jgi:hypothetical protein